MGKVFEKREVKCYNFSIKERGKLVNIQNKIKNIGISIAVFHIN